MDDPNDPVHIAEQLESIARGIRDGSVFVTLHMRASPDVDPVAFLASAYEPDTDVEGEPYTEQEIEDMRQSSIEYLKMFSSLVIYYKQSKPGGKKRSRAK